MRISVRTTFREGLDDTPFQEIIGRSGTLNRDLDDFEYLGQQPDSPFAFEETVFSFVLEPWDSWLGMHITEHAGPKKGRGGYAGRKYDAKRESDKARRQKSLILVDKDLDNFFDDRTHDKEDGQ